MSNRAAFARGFLHGITGAGLFHRITYSHVPMKPFLDPRAVEQVPIGEFASYLSAAQRAKARMLSVLKLKADRIKVVSKGVTMTLGEYAEWMAKVGLIHMATREPEDDARGARRNDRVAH